MEALQTQALAWAMRLFHTQEMAMNFLRATCAGAFAAGILPALAALAVSASFIGRNGAESSRSLLFALAPFPVAFLIVATGALVIGMPATLILKRTGRESAGAYASLSVVAGASMMTLILLLDYADWGFFPFLLVAAAGGGAVTGLSWWKHARKPAVESNLPVRAK